MKEEPNYFAIIPADVRYDKRLKDKAKLLYGEITALSNKNGYCYASNKYFAELYGVSTTTISLLIKNLVDEGYIQSELIYKEGTKEILNRYLRIIKEGYLNNFKEGYLRKVKDNNINNNNTSINNTYNNIYNVEIAKEIIDYLNLRTGAKYKYTTPKTQTLIKSRIREGFTVEDFKTVIDKKCVEWFNDSKMKQYIRPETLFGTKFEGYLNQEAVKKEVTTKDLAKHIDWEVFLNE